MVEADFLTLAPPAEPHRVVGNVPFAITTPILRRLLDDPALGAAPGRPDRPGRARPQAGGDAALDDARAAVAAVVAAPGRPAPAGRMLRPASRVDAALLAIRPRQPALLPAERAAAYRTFLEAGFTRDARPVRRALALPPRTWKRFARGRGLAPPPAPTSWTCGIGWRSSASPGR